MMRRARVAIGVLLLLQVGAISFGQGKFQIQTDSPLPAGTVGTQYSQTFSASGGGSKAPYTWSVVSGALPAGLALSTTGALTGTPSTADTADFTVRVVDGSAKPLTEQKSFKLTINPPPLSMTTTSPLASGTVGTSYSQTFAATGGTTPYTWTLISGTLPQGMNFSSSGVLGGTPTAAGSFNFTIRVRDKSEPQQSAQKAFSLTVLTPLSITTVSALPSGVVGTAYSQILNATGGMAPYTWSLASGSLPQGVSLSSGGVLAGTPAAEGSFNFTIRVRENSEAQQSSQKTFSLTVGAAVVPLSITTSSPLPSGTVGTAYSTQLRASGGAAPYQWSLRSGTLPQGLTFSSDGLLSGTPSTAGSVSFAIQVTDRTVPPQTANQTFTLVINNPTSLPSLTLTGLPADLNPTQQQAIGMALSAPFPAPLSGTLTLSFTPNAVAVTDDPMVMFSTGSRTVSFSIPANSRVAVFASPVLLLAGTVAGSINLTANLQGNQTQPVASVNVRLLPPQVKSVVAVRTQEGLRVEVTGYSPERTVQRVDFAFTVRTQAGVETVNLGRSVDSDFQNWYRSTASAAFGSSFKYVQTFLVQGDTTAIESVLVSLSNAQGSTSANRISFGN